VRKIKIIWGASVPVLCHRLATRLFGEGSDTCAMQEHLGHREVKPTMIYTRVLNRWPACVGSPVDFL
jgi:site-specific recombinase XerD